MKYIKKYHSTQKIYEIHKKYLNNVYNKNILILGSGKGIWEKYLSVFKTKIFSIDCKYNTIYRKNFFIKTDIFNNIFNFELCFFNKKFDIIICDICSNISGIKERDFSFFLKLYYKIKKIYNFFLLKNGILVFKFMNFCSITNKFYKLKKDFKIVKYIKLNSSKKKSSEFYSICKFFI
ncbi:SAM-dependent methyltransferase [Candidatus Vidania fulgoroideorum]